MRKPLIKVEKVEKSFGDNLVLKDVNLNVYEKEIIGLLGLSGSGKTTLLNIVCGFLKQDNGDVFYNASKYLENENFKSIHVDSKDFKSLIGFSAQNPSYYPELSVIENLRYFGTLYEVRKSDLPLRIEKVLRVLDLERASKIIAKDLSEGMKKRLDIACSLIHEPKVLILDEPTSNLDFKLREELLEYIQKINKEGITIIFVTHFIQELVSVCTKVLFLNCSSEVVTHVGPDLKRKFETFLKNDKAKEEQLKDDNLKDENLESESKKKNIKESKKKEVVKKEESGVQEDVRKKEPIKKEVKKNG